MTCVCLSTKSIGCVYFYTSRPDRPIGNLELKTGTRKCAQKTTIKFNLKRCFSTFFGYLHSAPLNRSTLFTNHLEQLMCSVLSDFIKWLYKETVFCLLRLSEMFGLLDGIPIKRSICRLPFVGDVRTSTRKGFWPMIMIIESLDSLLNFKRRLCSSRILKCVLLNVY